MVFFLLTEQQMPTVFVCTQFSPFFPFHIMWPFGNMNNEDDLGRLKEKVELVPTATAWVKGHC